MLALCITLCTPTESPQLASTLFGVCILQIKPQLETLLNLENDSLTKEISLTQDLMSLFLEYQIPVRFLFLFFVFYIPQPELSAVRLFLLFSTLTSCDPLIKTTVGPRYLRRCRFYVLFVYAH
jgi:hypothetical protein